VKLSPYTEGRTYTEDVRVQGAQERNWI